MVCSIGTLKRFALSFLGSIIMLMYATPITYMNRKQLSFIARFLGLVPTADMTNSDLVSLINS